MDTEINVFESQDGRFCLTITETDDETAELFEEYELQGGGYTWEGIVTSLIRTKMPEALSKFEIGAEGDNMYVYCSTREPLDRLAKVIRVVASDQDELIAAIEEVREELE